MITFLIRVISSWQIIVVTVALIIYITLVSHVARMYHRSDFSFDSKPKKEKEKKPETEAIPAEDDDLGLEE